MLSKEAVLNLIQKLKSNDPTITSVSFSNIPFCSTFKMVLEALQTNTKVTSIECQNSEYEPWQVEGIIALLKINKRIHTLKLQNCELQKHGLIYIINALLETGITSLNLSENMDNIVEKDMIGLSYLIEHPACKLKYLNIGANIAAKYCNLSSLITALSKNKTITYLDLSENIFFQQDIISLNQLMQVNTTITTLILRKINKFIRDFGIEGSSFMNFDISMNQELLTCFDISEGFVNNTTLTHLDISESALFNTMMGKILTKNKGINKLLMSGKLENDFVTALQTNTTLTALHINNIDLLIYSEHLAKIMRMNKTIIELKLEVNNSILNFIKQPACQEISKNHAENMAYITEKLEYNNNLYRHRCSTPMREAFVMGFHKRLGKKSAILKTLTPENRFSKELLQIVFEFSEFNFVNILRDAKSSEMHDRVMSSSESELESSQPEDSQALPPSKMELSSDVPNQNQMNQDLQPIPLTRSHPVMLFTTLSLNALAENNVMINSRDINLRNGLSQPSTHSTSHRSTNSSGHHSNNGANNGVSNNSNSSSNNSNSASGTTAVSTTASNRSISTLIGRTDSSRALNRMESFNAETMIDRGAVHSQSELTAEPLSLLRQQTLIQASVQQASMQQSYMMLDSTETPAMPSTPNAMLQDYGRELSELMQELTEATNSNSNSTSNSTTVPAKSLTQPQPRPMTPLKHSVTQNPSSNLTLLTRMTPTTPSIPSPIIIPTAVTPPTNANKEVTTPSTSSGSKVKRKLADILGQEHDSDDDSELHNLSFAQHDTPELDLTSTELETTSTHLTHDHSEMESTQAEESSNRTNIPASATSRRKKRKLR